MSTKRKVTSHPDDEELNTIAPIQKPINNSLTVKIQHLKELEPLTENQKVFYKNYDNSHYFMANTGSAGTGKTLISCYKGIQEVLSKDNPFSQLVVVRSAVATRDVGFLPGTLEEKTELYELPYVEAMRFLFNRHDAWQRLKEQGHCKFLTTTAIRGVTIDDAIIVVDEAQNMTMGELGTIMTRVGYRSKIIFCGDFKQNDLTKTKSDVSGFVEFMEIAKSMDEFSYVEFTPDDILRSSLVKNWIIACEKLGY